MDNSRAVLLLKALDGHSKAGPESAIVSVVWATVTFQASSCVCSNTAIPCCVEMMIED